MTFRHPDSGLPCMRFSVKNQRWEKQPVPVPVLLAYWGPRPAFFVRTFMKQGGVFVLPTPFLKGL